MNVHPTEYRYQKEIIKYLSSHEFNGLKYTYLKDGSMIMIGLSVLFHLKL